LEEDGAPAGGAHALGDPLAWWLSLVSLAQRHPDRAGEAAVEEADPGISDTGTSSEAGRVIVAFLDARAASASIRPTAGERRTCARRAKDASPVQGPRRVLRNTYSRSARMTCMGRAD
jgi:hypothetical protein